MAARRRRDKTGESHRDAAIVHLLNVIRREGAHSICAVVYVVTLPLLDEATFDDVCAWRGRREVAVEGSREV